MLNNHTSRPQEPCTKTRQVGYVRLRNYICRGCDMKFKDYHLEPNDRYCPRCRIILNNG